MSATLAAERRDKQTAASVAGAPSSVPSSILAGVSCWSGCTAPVLTVAWEPAGGVLERGPDGFVALLGSAGASGNGRGAGADEPAAGRSSVLAGGETLVSRAGRGPGVRLWAACSGVADPAPGAR